MWYIQWIPILTLLLLARPVLAQSTSLSVQDIVRRSAEATHADWSRVPGYDFCELDRSSDGSRTYEVLMISGSPYSRLVAINGRALPTAAENEEERKLEMTIEHRRLENIQDH
jgi:hypothetical protein